MEHPAFESMPLVENPRKKDIVSEEKSKSKPGRPVSLWKLSDASGSIEMTEIESGTCHKANLCSNDIFIYDALTQIFVWVGKAASRRERYLSMIYAQNYAEKIGDPKLPLVSIFEGQDDEEMISQMS
ncbi:Gelsolin-like protein 1 [Thelohanellus kitauei]|uniref:Gelsolin-like protein 1 n=1 Tax=Thelohanellus kitauei TaxID=669202 RepID=A0A0C2N6X2_THEKT|nr:Gelsolin-like protein 1 [Thelohanellus kitauei]